MFYKSQKIQTSDQRLILFHKQDVSARLRFLIFPTGLLAFTPLPRLAHLKPEQQVHDVVHMHPAFTLRYAEEHLGAPQGLLKVEPSFYAEVEIENEIVPIVLVEFTSIDPPFLLAERFGAKFVSLSDARGLHPVELELAGRAYRKVLGWG